MGGLRQFKNTRPWRVASSSAAVRFAYVAPDLRSATRVSIQDENTQADQLNRHGRVHDEMEEQQQGGKPQPFAQKNPAEANEP